MITEQDLISRGYTKYDFSAFCFPYSDFFYQKCFRDEIGRKYFIEFIHYSAIGKCKEAWKCHFNINGDDKDVPHTTLEFHGITDLDWVERKMGCFWLFMGSPYYEKNGE